MRFQRFLYAAAAGSLAAAAPLFAQDSTTSLPSSPPPAPPRLLQRQGGAVVFDSATLRRLPIDDLREVPALVPGVFTFTDARRFSIRGSASEAATLYVDGAAIQNGQLGRPLLMPSLNGVRQLSVATGLPELARGPSPGILDVTTPSGGRRLAADLRYRTDDVGGNGVGQFSPWRNVGFNRLEATVSGPVVAGITAFGAAALEGQRSLETQKFRDVQAPIYIASGTDTIVRQPATVGDPASDTIDLVIPEFVQYSGYCDRPPNGGHRCYGLGVPFSSQGGRFLQGRLEGSYGAQSRVSLTLLSGRRQARELSLAELYNPTNRTATRESGYAVILGWSHRELRLAGKPFRIDANVSVQSDRHVSGPLTPGSELSSREPFGGFLFKSLDFVTDFETTHDITIGGARYTAVRFLDPAQIRCVQAGSAACADMVPFPDRNDLLSAQPYRANPYAVVHDARLPFYTAGLDNPIDLSRERRVQARVVFDWNVAAAHTVQLGIEQLNYDTRRFAAQAISAFAINAYNERPVRRAFWIGDQLRIAGANVAGGVRLDQFESRSSYPLTPGRISSDPAFNPANPTGGFFPAGQHTALSPQISGYYQVNERLAIHAAVGQTARMPTFESLFQHKNTDLSIANAATVFGRDLGLARERLLELGGRAALDRGFAVDVSLYSRKVEQEIVRLARFTDPATGFPIDLRIFTIADPGAVIGFDVTLEQSLSPWFAGYLSYTHEGGDALDHGRHVVVGSFALTVPPATPVAGTLERIVANVEVLATARFGSNVRYTRQRNQGQGFTIGDVVDPIEPIDASILPSHKSFDLRIARRSRLGRGSAVLFVESRNLFNWSNLVDIFTETETVTNSPQRSRWVGQQVAQLEAEARDNALLITDPSGQPAVDLQAPGVCAGWASRGSYAGGPADCVLLQRAERRFGNGDGLYTRPEFTAAFDAWYDLANAPYRFYGPGRRIRIGVELGF